MAFTFQFIIPATWTEDVMQSFYKQARKEGGLINTQRGRGGGAALRLVPQVCITLRTALFPKPEYLFFAKRQEKASGLSVERGKAIIKMIP